MNGMAELAKWDSFYVIVGSAAGGLIGLQFVVVALIADKVPRRAEEAGAAFATPNIVHFVAAFSLSALLRVPWETMTAPAALWGLVGVCGVVYASIIARRMRRQTAYRPVFEDWLFHAILPAAAYAVLALAALAAFYGLPASLFGVGAGALLLLFIGIHNAWDSAAYHVFVQRAEPEGSPRPPGTSETE